MPKTILEFPVDEEDTARKILALMHMHTKNAKTTKQSRQTGFYGIIVFYTTIGIFSSRQNAEIAKKAINERFFG